MLKLDCKDIGPLASLEIICSQEKNVKEFLKKNIFTLSFEPLLFYPIVYIHEVCHLYVYSSVCLTVWLSDCLTVW